MHHLFSTLPLAIPGYAEIWIPALLLILLFGARKLPELARSMGSSINQFKKGLKEEDPKLPEEASEGRTVQD